PRSTAPPRSQRPTAQAAERRRYSQTRSAPNPIPGGNLGRKLGQRPSPRTTKVRKSLSFQGFCFIAGAGLIPNPATVDAPQTGSIAHRVEESCLLRERVAS